MSIKLSKIETVKSYSRTLRSFEVGEVRHYELVGIDYVGFYVARKRLAENKWGDFAFEKVKQGDMTLFKIERTQ